MPRIKCLLVSGAVVIGTFFVLSSITPLFAANSTNSDIDSKIDTLRTERQGLLDIIKKLEMEAGSARERINEIDGVLEGFLLVQRQDGLSRYQGEGIPFKGKDLVVYRRLNKGSRVGRIDSQEEFVLLGPAEKVCWWQVEYQGGEGYVYFFHTFADWLIPEEVNILDALRNLERAEGTDGEERARASVQEAIESRAVAKLKAAETKERLKRERIEEEKAEELAAQEAIRQENETFEARKAFGKGKWRHSKKQSPIDDSLTVALTLNAERQIESKWGSNQPRLVVRCKEGLTSVYVNWGIFIGSGDTIVTTRLDKELATNIEWKISTDHEATFHPRTVDFIRGLWSHDSLFIQVTPYGESPVNTKFDLRGLAVGVGSLREACNW
jgi:type VI secretion system protein VasI